MMQINKQKLGVVLLACWLMLFGGRVLAQNNGTAFGSPTYTSLTGWGQYIVFNGSSQYVTVPNTIGQFASGASWTVELRVKSTSTGTMVAIGRNDTSGSGGGTWWMGAIGGNAEFNIAGFTTFASSATTTPICDGSWHTLAMVCVSGTRAMGFVDGVLVRDSNVVGSGTYPGAGTTPVQNGISYWSATSVYWNGAIDEVRYSNSARYTSTYTAATVPFTSDGSTLALYHFDGNANDSTTPSPTYSLSPSSATAGTPLTITATGSNTSWVNGTTTFSVSGGSGASISSVSINNSTQVATFTLNPGSAAGTLTITDSTYSVSQPVSVSAASTTTVNLVGSSMYISANWKQISPSGGMATVYGGAFIDGQFSGTSAVLGGITINPNCSCRVAWSIDNGAYAYANLTNGTTSLNLTPALLANTTHKLSFIYSAALAGTEWGGTYPISDRWNSPSITITSLTLDGGATVSGPIYVPTGGVDFVGGDSIVESQNNYFTPDALNSFVWSIGQAFDSRVCIMGQAGQAIRHGNTGVNVPPFHTTGNDAQSSYNKYYSGQSMLSGGKFSPMPTRYWLAHGHNDYLYNDSAHDNVSAATFQQNYYDTITDLRACLNTTVPIICIVDFARKYVTQINAAVAAYKAATGDSYVYVIDPNKSTGLDYGFIDTPASAPTAVSGDGIHPYPFMDLILGGNVARLGYQAINASTGATERRLLH